MKFSILISETARKQLNKLEEIEQIRQSLSVLEEDPFKSRPLADIKKLKDDELNKLMHELMKIYVKRSSSSSTIDGFALGSDVLMAKKIKKVCGDMKFSKVFSILTAPVYPSFINQADLSLLEVALGKKKMVLP